jgi:hypothetical protein
MSRRKLLAKQRIVEWGDGTVPPLPGERVVSTRVPPNGREPSYAVITEPMKRRKRDLWNRWSESK